MRRTRARTWRSLWRSFMPREVLLKAFRPLSISFPPKVVSLVQTCHCHPSPMGRLAPRAVVLAQHVPRPSVPGQDLHKREDARSVTLAGRSNDTPVAALIKRDHEVAVCHRLAESVPIPRIAREPMQQRPSGDAVGPLL
jgi:hypothetical protein